MKFAEYLTKHGITQEDAAKALETSQGSVSRWVQGDFIPNKETMQKIVAYTNGEVQPNDFYGVSDGEQN